MSVSYFPGCTLSTKGAGYDRSGRATAEALGMPFQELEEWQCCGATFPLATDNTMSFIAPTRLLTQAQEAGGHVTTLCAICFHVLRRTQHFLEDQPEALERINWFTEETYEGEARVSHFLELLRDEIGWEELAEKVKKPLAGLKVAPYYGCLLLRPQDEMELDDPDDPHILHDFLAALGAEAADFPLKNECCGSYLLVSKPDIPKAISMEIVESARKNGAEMIVTTCPLCQFNLDYPQRKGAGAIPGVEVPVVYFTQLLAAALDLEEADWGMEGHYIDPLPILKEKIVDTQSS
jgi:heterodisulfide reductase subunit B